MWFCGKTPKCYTFSLVPYFLYFNINALVCQIHYFKHKFIHNFLLYCLLLHPPLRVINHHHSLLPVHFVLYCCGVWILAPNVTQLQQKLPRCCVNRVRLTSDWCGEIMSWAAGGSKGQIKAEVHTRIDKQIYNKEHHNLCFTPRVFSVYRHKLNT